MKPENPSPDPNQGEGDKLSARHYNRQVRDFVAAGKVDPAARQAERFVEDHPDEAQRAEQAAQRGPQGSKVSIDELVAKGRTVIGRMRPMIDRAVGKLRTKLGHK